jgi:2Fe-2S ferredoxin
MTAGVGSNERAFMPRVIYVGHFGEEYEVEVPVGGSLMEAAVAHEVPGIDADCGGQCACGTCHVYIDPQWHPRLPPMGDQERTTLEFSVDVDSRSRLSCRLRMTPELDGIVLTVPRAQH